MDPNPLLTSLLPAEVHCAEQFGAPREPAGLPEERAAIAHALASRRDDYLGVRDCARTALAALGFAPVPIGTGPKREPIWPEGIVGSLTHCAGYRAAAVARSRRMRSVGIDAEPHERLPAGVLETVGLPEEVRAIAALDRSDPRTHWDRVLFCAKEAVYKAWYPLTGEWLGFEEASVSIETTGHDLRRHHGSLHGGRFSARLLRPGPTVDDAPLTCFDGRWTVASGLIATVVLVPAAAP
ncbi:MAG TPA: 4'-phosphopantetheinyl transferase superfamily protein [Pseudonocardia sp.]|nr:4'-phosphopantetheinyl transferase superfamily protein [Pseudonocardia sp.]